jgi:hypothetical protein
MFDSKILIGAIGGAALTLSIATIGYFVNDYLSFLHDHRKEIMIEYDDSKLAEQKVLADIQKFANQANGVHVVTSADKESLRENLQILYTKEQYLAKRMPDSKKEFDDLGSAMLGLQESATEFTGPANAKPFIEATSKFLNAKKDFDKRAIDLQERYWSSSL